MISNTPEMQIQVEAGLLQQALQQVLPIRPGNLSKVKGLPISLKFSKPVSLLQVIDAQNESRASTLPARGEWPEIVQVDGNRLGALVDKLSAKDEVRLCVSDGEIVVRVGNFRMSMPRVDRDAKGAIVAKPMPSQAHGGKVEVPPDPLQHCVELNDTQGFSARVPMPQHRDKQKSNPEQIVNAYGDLLAKGYRSPLSELPQKGSKAEVAKAVERVKSVDPFVLAGGRSTKELPAPKGDIEAAITLALGHERDPSLRNSLEVALITLADFQDVEWCRVNNVDPSTLRLNDEKRFTEILSAASSSAGHSQHHKAQPTNMLPPIKPDPSLAPEFCEPSKSDFATLSTKYNGVGLANTLRWLRGIAIAGVIGIAIGYPSYLLYQKAADQVAREAAVESARKEKRKEIQNSVRRMVLKHDANENWDRKLSEGGDYRLGPILSVELERVWLTGQPILFKGKIVDIATHDGERYRIRLSRDAYASFTHFEQPLQLVLLCNRSLFDRLSEEFPDILDTQSFDRGVAVIATMDSLDSERLIEDGEPVEVRVGYGTLVDLIQVGEIPF